MDSAVSQCACQSLNAGDRQHRTLAYYKMQVLCSGRLQPFPQTLNQAVRFARDKQSSSLWKSVNYSRKKFYSTGPCDKNGGENACLSKLAFFIDVYVIYRGLFWTECARFVGNSVASQLQASYKIITCLKVFIRLVGEIFGWIVMKGPI